MNRLWLVWSLVLAASLEAQQPPPAARDTIEAERLRAQIEQRFGQHVKQQLRLTDDQAAKLRGTQERFGERHRALLRQQVQRRMALNDQMQPGVAANSDSVRKLMDGLQGGRAELLKIEQDEDRDMAAYLTPVQRARYQEMRRRFLDRVNEMRQERRERVGGRPRMGPPGGRRPGQGPGPQRRPRRGSI
jgi:periplasmic protein CpxP/Spy